jgi:glycosyltransferase involved in cell wall biosynthesis
VSTDPIVYAAFDRFPAPKGAAVHIDAFVRGLSRAFGPLDLVTVAPVEDTPAPVDFEEVTHHRLPAPGANLIERVLCFRAHLAAWWKGRRASVAHVRSVFEGYPIAKSKGSRCDRFVFEVNGLPSVELKYHYPAVADDDELLRKLTAMERACLEEADLVVTVSQVTANYLTTRGVTRERIRVIPNGVDLDRFPYQTPTLCRADRPIQLLYAGTMSPWQGVRLAIEALALCRRDRPATLTLAGPARPRQRSELTELSAHLGVLDAVRWVGPVDREELARRHHESDVVLAPLTPGDRNLVQGCCPLKVLEAMASGTPLVASDLPVVRELARAEVDALLVRPGSAKAIKDAVFRLADDPGLALQLSTTARAAVERGRTWADARRALVTAYEEVLGMRRASRRRIASRSTAG